MILGKHRRPWLLKLARNSQIKEEEETNDYLLTIDTFPSPFFGLGTGCDLTGGVTRVSHKNNAPSMQ